MKLAKCCATVSDVSVQITDLEIVVNGSVRSIVLWSLGAGAPMSRNMASLFAQVPPKVRVSVGTVPPLAILWFHQKTPRYSLIGPVNPSWSKFQRIRAGGSL